MVNQGSGYTNATVRFEEGWVTPQQVDEYVLGETITIGLTAYAKSAEIQRNFLLVINDVRTENNQPPKSIDSGTRFMEDYQFPSQEFGLFTGQGQS